MGMWASQDGSIKEESWGYTTNTYSNDSKYMCFFPNGFMVFFPVLPVGSAFGLIARDSNCLMPEMAPRCWIPWFSGTKCSELSWSRCQNMWGAGVIFWLGFFKQNGRWGSHMSHSCCLEAPELFMSWLKFQSLTNKKQRSTMIDLTHAMKTGGTTGMVCGTPIIKQP